MKTNVNAYGVMSWTVDGAVNRAVNRAVDRAVVRAVNRAVDWAVIRAVDYDPPHPTLVDFLSDDPAGGAP